MHTEERLFYGKDNKHLNDTNCSEEGSVGQVIIGNSLESMGDSWTISFNDDANAQPYISIGITHLYVSFNRIKN